MNISRRTLLGGTAAAVTIAETGATCAVPPVNLRAGAGKAVIPISPDLLPMQGFTTVHDDLYVRVLVVDDDTTRIALVVADFTSLPADLVTRVRTAVAAATTTTDRNVLVQVTHTFSTPHAITVSGLPSAEATKSVTLANRVTAAAAAAADTAVTALRSARIGCATGHCEVNVNRNARTADGWWLGAGQSLPSDKTLAIARIDDTAGHPIAVLMNYDVQSAVMSASVMSDGGLAVTADLAGAAVDHVERQYGGGTLGFFLVGACGDQAPAYVSNRYTIGRDLRWATVDSHEAGWLLLALQGERLGSEAVRVTETIDTSASAPAQLLLVTDSLSLPGLRGSNHVTTPVRTLDTTPGPARDTLIRVLWIGAGALAGVAPELSSATAMFIKQRSPFPITFVLSMLDGGDKNMARSWDYEHATYAAQDSPYAAGAAERAADRIVAMLWELHP
ncbi:hypothetical protein K7711_16115 [Nocardia sp. CA2R105]|uniref:hypothetical protein n=1 Tax=Nocardia coffeae TaxID=2873381 RepID=UPI001CA68A7D|nr:hypothetical protein [Nocardia coffeae]MBY8858012.1 hypothetical protein [Nocardia coffeae]